MARDLIRGDITIRSIKHGDQRKRLSDGDGLYLLLFVKGGAHGWRFDYSIVGRRKTLSLGTYPDTGLKLAREKAQDARQQVAAGIDPSDTRKQNSLSMYKRASLKIERKQAYQQLVALKMLPENGMQPSIVSGRPAMVKKLSSVLKRMCSGGLAVIPLMALHLCNCWKYSGLLRREVSLKLHIVH